MKRINHQAPMSTTLLTDQQSWTAEEILQRTRFATGSMTGVVGYGIVDSRDPATTLSGSTRPFTVTPSSTSIAITVQGGTLFFGNGEMITVPTIQNIAVPTTYLGERHVLYATFVEEGHDPRYDDYDVQVYLWYGEPSDPIAYLRIARKVDYDALPLSTRQSTVVPLALLTPTTTSVTVDHTRAELTDARPWATPIDIQHRSYVGSGTATTRNPHALAISDLSVSGTATLFDFLLPHGIILSRDTGVAGIPGRLCFETIPALGVLTDVTGAVTGYVGALYFSASKFPTQVLSCVDAATSTKQIALAQIPSKNLLFFLPEDEWLSTEDLNITYIAADAAAPPTGSNLTTFTASQPLDTETIVAGGVVVPSVMSPLSYVTAGPYPFQTQVYMTDAGELRRNPETVKCDIRLADVTGAQALELQPIVPSQLRVGMRGAVAGPTLVVEIDITGIRADDSAQVTETVRFDSTWTDSVIPTIYENSNQWKATATTFSSVSSWTVKTRTNDGPNTAITIQATYETNHVDLSNDLPVSEVFWDGLRFSDIRDARPLRIAATSVGSIDLAAATAAFAESTLLRSTAPTKAIVGAWYDDFEAPSWASDSNTSVSRWSTGLGLLDTYTSRPILVRPHIDDAVSLRVQPVTPDQGFTGWIRVFTRNTNAWSAWIPLLTLVSPKYTYNFAAGDKLLKWQFRMKGPVRGMMAVYLAAGDAIPPTLIFDSGAFGIDTLG
jgi:hypothetical protein